MKNFTLTLLSLVVACTFVAGQNNISVTLPEAEQVLTGNYDPSDYAPSQNFPDPRAIISAIHEQVNPDSLKSYLIKLSSFGNRNSASDTVSDTRGIGAARRWVYSRFQEFSTLSEGRLLPAYLQFDRDMCGVLQHRNIMAVLPGMDTTDVGIVLIEGHIDSRCADVCDTACTAQGVEDNASGTALVMELARVMSQYSFKNTIVFMVTTGEEQGLVGASAFRNYVTFDHTIPVEAVLNNDIVGGIICGATSSPPSCPGENHIDSTQVRLFSKGVYYSEHKGLARFVKLEYQEELLPVVEVPMQITIMTAEDRGGRGGDHLPFSAYGYPAIRFTSANEHGDAGNGPDYHDRQHTEEDILGVDTDGDSKIDSFFVDFNYLARNAVINGVAGAVAALGPLQPVFDLEEAEGQAVKIDIQSPVDYPAYRIGIHTTSNDFDTVLTINTMSFTLPIDRDVNYYISVASVDEHGLESTFAEEQWILVTDIAEIEQAESGMALLQNKPNPFDETTVIAVRIDKPVRYEKAVIEIRDMQGRLVETLPINLNGKVAEVLYEHGYGHSGTYTYSLVVDGNVMDRRSMIFAN